MQGAYFRELQKCQRGPTPQSALFYDGIELLAEYSSSRRAEFHHPDILTVGVVHIHLLGNFHYLSATGLDLHFFFPIRILLPETNQESILVLCSEKIRQKLRVEKYIRIHHYEPIQKKISR